MLKARSTRIGVTVFAVAALLALSVLPAEHVHGSSSGHAIVHRHLIDDSTDHAAGSSLGHDDHASVKTLDSAFVSQREYGVHRPLIAAALAVASPDRRFAGRVVRIDTAPTHGPPIRIRSLRAPPANASC